MPTGGLSFGGILTWVGGEAVAVGEQSWDRRLSYARGFPMGVGTANKAIAVPIYTDEARAW